MNAQKSKRLYFQPVEAAEPPWNIHAAKKAVKMEARSEMWENSEWHSRKASRRGSAPDPQLCPKVHADVTEHSRQWKDFKSVRIIESKGLKSVGFSNSFKALSPRAMIINALDILTLQVKK